MIVTSPNSIFLNQTPIPSAEPPPAQICGTDVYYINNPLDECGATVCIYFKPLYGAHILKYTIYRSMVGFVADVIPQEDLDGLTLTLAINQGPHQTLTFTGGKGLVEQINGYFHGVYAKYSIKDPTKFLLRVTEQGEESMLQVVGGSSLTSMNTSARTIYHLSEDQVVDYIEAKENDDVNGVEYCDPDGEVTDYYAAATVNHDNEESFKTRYKSPQETVGKLCGLYGIVSNLLGVRLPGVPVTVRAVQLPQSVTDATYIDMEPVTVHTNAYGFWEVPVLQKALVHVEIPDVKMHRTVVIPEMYRVRLSDLCVDRGYRLPLDIR